MTLNTSDTEVNEDLLAALLDRLIPAVGELPPAGQMGLVPEIVRLSGRHDLFHSEFANFMISFSASCPEFESLSGNAQDEAIRAFESGSPELFSTLLTISYIVYYKDERVHRRIGWSGRPPQPDGNEMELWDESILENVRNREPFWRQV